MKSSLIHLVIACVATIAVAICYSFWFSVVSASSTYVSGLQNQIDIKTETIGRIASTRSALSQIENDEAAIQSHFIPKSGIVTFIDGLEAQGSTNGAATNVLSVSANDSGVYPTFIFSLVIRGTFNSVMRAIGIIEYAPYALSVSGLSLAQGEKGTWQADLKLVVGSIATGTSTPSTP